ncbi:MAG: class C beta-lactamase-related serine hydrolase [Chitinophagaceae bacterium]|nr:MAG: class C beta-lactamase-related serine hydrolase [Chitinophagaceae bacterium]
MKNLVLFLAGFLVLSSCKKEKEPGPTPPASNNIYFPKAVSTTWETISAESLGWNTSQLPALYTFLESEQTRAFLVLKDGRIVLEKYFGQTILGSEPFTANSLWYWASAGKTLTSFVVGKAQKEGFLSIADRSANYLGTGWTSMQPAKENLITVRHQLTMTSGLDDGGDDPGNTSPQALVYKADAGTRWAYHNAPYTLLHNVVAKATGKSFTAYFEEKLKNPIGMDGQWIKKDNDNVYWSTPRSMARFGILMLAGGRWEDKEILGDADYFNASIATSQNLNLSYGYLWWLNGKASAMLPQSQIVFTSSLNSAAPADMVSAMGKNGQVLSIVPSKGLVIVRMGLLSDGSFISLPFQTALWERLRTIIK